MAKKFVAIKEDIETAIKEYDTKTERLSCSKSKDRAIANHNRRYGSVTTLNKVVEKDSFFYALGRKKEGYVCIYCCSANICAPNETFNTVISATATGGEWMEDGEGDFQLRFFKRENIEKYIETVC